MVSERELIITPISEEEFLVEKRGHYERILPYLSDLARVVIDGGDYLRMMIHPPSLWSAVYRGRAPGKSLEEIETCSRSPFPLSFQTKIEREMVNARDLIRRYEKKHALHPPPAIERVIESEVGRILRQGQREALDAMRGHFLSGVICLPGGYGKTLFGLCAAMAYDVVTWTVIPDRMIARQWKEEAHKWMINKDESLSCILNKVQFITYHQFAREGTLSKKRPALVIFDEAHRISDADLDRAEDMPQAVKLGLTASWQPEGPRAERLFEEIGPVVYDFRGSEKAGRIVSYREVFVSMSASLRSLYIGASNVSKRHRFASTNPEKILILKELLQRHLDRRIIVMGHYLDQLKEARENTGLEIITGETSIERRAATYRRFNRGEITAFISSDITNESIDFPRADCLIQLSGRRGYSLEEYQRLGRVSRHHLKKVIFYSLVTRGSEEENSAAARKSFLSSRGVRFERLDF